MWCICVGRKILITKPEVRQVKNCTSTFPRLCYLTDCPPICLPVCLSVCPSVYLFIICLSLSVHLSCILVREAVGSVMTFPRTCVTAPCVPSPDCSCPSCPSCSPPRVPLLLSCHTPTHSSSRWQRKASLFCLPPHGPLLPLPLDTSCASQVSLQLLTIRPIWILLETKWHNISPFKNSGHEFAVSILSTSHK